MSISNSDDIIDSREVIERIDELTGERADLERALDEARTDFETAAGIDDIGDINPSVRDSLPAEREAYENAVDALSDWDSDNAAELRALESLQDDLSGYASDWRHGVTLVRDSYFEEYAREMADDLHGNEMRNASWPFDCIDWKRAASELQQDYTSAEFDGVTYWAR